MKMFTPGTLDGEYEKVSAAVKAGDLVVLTAWFFSWSLVVLCFLSAFWKEKKQEALLSLMRNGNNAVGVGSGSKTFLVS